MPHTKEEHEMQKEQYLELKEEERREAGGSDDDKTASDEDAGNATGGSDLVK